MTDDWPTSDAFFDAVDPDDDEPDDFYGGSPRRVRAAGQRAFNALGEHLTHREKVLALSLALAAAGRERALKQLEAGG